jgi:hypothetical protein
MPALVTLPPRAETPFARARRELGASLYEVGALLGIEATVAQKMERGEYPVTSLQLATLSVFVRSPRSGEVLPTLRTAGVGAAYAAGLAHLILAA